MANLGTSLLPIEQTERIDSLDILRGFVILGILLMNIVGFGLWGAYRDPTVSGGADGLNRYAWMATNLFFEGTMRGLLSLLFGAGAYILISRLEKQGAGIEAANIYFRRTLWMMFFGLLHGYLLLWVGEILFQYGLMGLLIFSFRNMAPWKLVLIAIVLMVGGTIWEYADHRSNVKLVENIELAQRYKSEGKALTKELKDADKKWENMQYERSSEYVNEQFKNMRKGYLHIVAFLAPINNDTDTLWPYRYDLWDVLSMMLIGIALFRWRVITAERSFKFYILLALVGYGIGIPINYYELQVILNSNFSFLAFSQANCTYYWGRLFTAAGHIGLIMIFCKLPILLWLKTSLASVGKMALTTYLTHSLICMLVFTGVGFGLFGKLQRYELYYVVASIWIFQLIVSPIWLSYFRFGPAEWLWRSCTYLKIQPMIKRTRPVPGNAPAI